MVDMKVNSHKLLQKFKYPKDIDKELIPMLNIINSIPGVRTVFSCCGHGKEDFYLVLAYTSCHTRSYIENIFQRTKIAIKGFNDELLDDDVFCGKFRVHDLGNMENNDMIFENYVGYYNESWGLMTKKERLEQYKKICKFLEKLVPNEYW